MVLAIIGLCETVWRCSWKMLMSNSCDIDEAISFVTFETLKYLLIVIVLWGCFCIFSKKNRKYCSWVLTVLVVVFSLLAMVTPVCFS